jgi:hypothetical protein
LVGHGAPRWNKRNGQASQTEAIISCIGIIDTLENLRSLLGGTLNTTTCATCGHPVTADGYLPRSRAGLPPSVGMTANTPPPDPAGTTGPLVSAGGYFVTQSV